MGRAGRARIARVQRRPKPGLRAQELIGRMLHMELGVSMPLLLGAQLLDSMRRFVSLNLHRCARSRSDAG